MIACIQKLSLTSNFIFLPALQNCVIFFSGRSYKKICIIAIKKASSQLITDTFLEYRKKKTYSLLVFTADMSSNMSYGLDIFLICKIKRACWKIWRNNKFLWVVLQQRCFNVHLTSITFKMTSKITFVLEEIQYCNQAQDCLHVHLTSIHNVQNDVKNNVCVRRNPVL